jgi:DNA-binding transcriptional regulator YhcF (GntR family)
MWNPAPLKGRPIYSEIVGALERNIASGKLVGGERLPVALRFA